MPSYIDDTLPSYYETEFPINVSAWWFAREASRIFTGQPTVNKMRVMEWAIKGLFRLDDKAALTMAAHIAESERKLPKPQQKFGNLLAVLKSKVGTGIKDHEQIEEMFKFILGKLAPQNTELFNTLLHITVDYARAYDITLPEEILTYDNQHRELPASNILNLQLEPVLNEQSPRFTPLADQPNSASTAEDTASQVQTADVLQDDIKQTNNVVSPKPV